MAKHHGRAHHGHHGTAHTELHGGHHSPKPKMKKSGHGGSTTGTPFRGHHVMKDGPGDGHVHPDHAAANSAFGMHEGFNGGEHYMHGDDQGEDNEECC
jgi:hypothetical protein